MFKMMSGALLAWAVLFPVSANADVENDWTISYHFHTDHTSADQWEDKDTGEKHDWNENNKFVGIRWEKSKYLGFGVAYGENSFFEKSFVVEMDLREVVGRIGPGQLELGTNLFLASGYENQISGGILPAINPYFRYRSDSGLSIKLGTVNFATLNLIAEYTFDLH